jgi:predicted regulator of Ras-like GTPase activity (Roadblock/LC7/MglB family)
MAKRYRVELLQDELADLCQRIEGIEQAVVVSLDGFVAASYPPAAGEAIPTSLDSPNVAATAASAISLGENALGRLDHGGLERLIIEGESGAMIIYPIGQRNAALVAMVRRGSKMGLVSLAMRRITDNLATIIDPGTGEGRS